MATLIGIGGVFLGLWLTSAGRRARIVVPFSAGLHSGMMSGPFVILRFPLNGDGKESEPATVYVDGFTGALYLDKPGEVKLYAQAFGGIWDACLDETASQDLFHHAAEEL